MPAAHSSRLAAVAALVMALLAVAAPAEAEKCGPRAGGAKCASAAACCSKYGWCGVGPRFCAVGKCISGACDGSKKPTPNPQPKPQPGMHVVEMWYGGTARLRCVGGRVITQLWGIRYGNPAKKCSSPVAPKIVSSMCLRKTECSIAVTTPRFGNPCPGVPKSLRVGYRCEMPSKPVPRPSPKPSPRPSPKPSPSPKGVQYSKLWGKGGELWRATSRLTDQSYSGYMANEARIPTYPVRFNVKAFGAKGNGRTDDTAAFKKAIDAASRLAATMSQAPDPGMGFQNGGRSGVTILVPSGTYRITQTLEIEQSNVVLKGEGAGRTTLYYPKSLSAIYGNKEEWAVSGSFLTITGFNPGFRHSRSALAAITVAARRGDKKLWVANTRDISVGMWVRIVALERYKGFRGRRLAQAGSEQAASIIQQQQQQQVPATANQTSEGGVPGGLLPLTAALRRALDIGRADLLADMDTGEDGVTAAAAAGSLDSYLYGDMPDLNSGRNSYPKADHINFVTRVAAKGPNWIKLERLLNYDLRLHWKPYVYRYSPEVQHSGFESFTVRFAHGFYPEHHTAYGFNGLGIYDSGNCWIRNVKVVNADNAIGAFRSEFVSVRGVTVSVEKPRYTKSTFPANGHHALWGSGAVLTEFSGFRITTQYMHDITFSVFAENLVFANGQMLDGNIDFHRGGPHNNLASNINLGRGTRAFHSGGNTVRGTHAAANNTVWNVGPASKRQVALPGCDFGPHLVFVGSYAPPTPGAEGDSNSGDRRRRSLLASPQLTGWCRQRRWWVEDVPTTQQLLPRDLYAAMVATRRNRIRG